jgi:hypothetical protein
MIPAKSEVPMAHLESGHCGVPEDTPQTVRFRDLSVAVQAWETGFLNCQFNDAQHTRMSRRPNEITDPLPLELSILRSGCNGCSGQTASAICEFEFSAADAETEAKVFPLTSSLVTIAHHRFTSALGYRSHCWSRQCFLE